MLLKTTRRFTEYLDGKNIKYTAKENEGKSDWVSVKYSADNMESINLSFFFDQDCQSFALRVFSIAKVPQNKIPAVLSVCNELANEYRWVRFYVDNDNEITASYDGVIDVDTAAPVCYELLGRTLSIVDEGYPRFMKALWS